METLNPKKFGIIVKTAPFAYPDEDVVFDGRVPYKSGLLLPDLEGVDTIEQQISIACQKGGINPGKEKIIIYKFTVKKYQQNE
jgi:AMMECR1 domain-containing protein